MIASKAVVTEQGGSTSHAAVVGRALGLPCVVACGRGSLEALACAVVTVDGEAGKIYAGALPIEAANESDHEALTMLYAWAAARSPLRVALPSAPEASEAIDLSCDDAAADPTRIAEALRSVRGARGARGGAIASDEGVRAAIAAGLEFIVADPVLPPLLAALRCKAVAASSDLNERT
jgi:pyruvate,orthophosphate dikinase